MYVTLGSSNLTARLPPAVAPTSMATIASGTTVPRSLIRRNEQPIAMNRAKNATT